MSYFRAADMRIICLISKLAGIGNLEHRGLEVYLCLTDLFVIMSNIFKVLCALKVLILEDL